MLSPARGAHVPAGHLSRTGIRDCAFRDPAGNPIRINERR
jgi:hypothetical protein